ncbi:MAG: hypothetical protein ACREBC_02710, partial [Pyrinomonadaceae bacterium]
GALVASLIAFLLRKNINFALELDQRNHPLCAEAPTTKPININMLALPQTRKISCFATLGRVLKTWQTILYLLGEIKTFPC